ncbi:MAG: sugar phosphate isomerase/epimerase [Kiritimatiellae bacterium]|jgi:sugar phosphate isomerase/epimerase|nr:sugar phosphate isomerase/epimerase [Kiritimatiellia bacterium]
MNISRRDFLGSAAFAGAAAALPGCCSFCCCAKPQVAVQLYSIHQYIGGVRDRKTKALIKPGVGIAKALEDVAKIGYKGVELAGKYGLKAKELKKLLDDNGLVACGDHVGGWRNIQGDKLKELAEYNLELGNTTLICPGATGPDNMNWSNPVWDAKCDEHMKFICEFFNERAQVAKSLGCKVGIHNHMWEFQLKNKKGETFWDLFFSGTSKDVLMEQDVGWTTCAGYDPCEQYRKYPGRSVTLHAKENGMGKNVTKFDAILGQPGQPGAKGVDWDKLAPVADADGVKWWVVECERHFDGLMPVTESFKFLKSKGRC